MSDTTEKKSNKLPPVRTFVKDFVDEASSVAVRVQKTQGFRPYYAIVVGRYVENERGVTVMPYIPVRAEVEHARIKSLAEHAACLAKLVTEATAWIREQVQIREDEIITAKQAREMRGVDGGPKAKPGLKKLGKLDSGGVIGPDGIIG